MHYPKINSKNSALLVIDVVNSCAHPKCEDKEYGITFAKIRKMIPKLAKFIPKFKKDFGGEVIYVNITPWTKKYLAKNIIELYKDPKCEYYSDDESGFESEYYGIKPESSDQVFIKNTMDAFANPELASFLKKKKIQYLIVAGIFGDGCVQATINGGFSAGFNFVILKDLVETTDVPVRQKLQELMKKYTWPAMYGPTMKSEEFLKHYSK